MSEVSEFEDGPLDDGEFADELEGDEFEDEDDDEMGGILIGGNDENEALDREIKAKQLELMDLENELEENTRRVMTMGDHLKNVQQESAQTKELADAKQRDLESLTHQAQLAGREQSRFVQEESKTKKAIQSQSDELNLKQNQIFAGQQRIDQIQQEMKWGDEQLKEWLEAARQREEDTDVINKYKAADEARTKQLQLELEAETLAAQRDQALLEKEVTETHSHELGLDKISLLFNKIHHEKQQLIDRWEKTLNAMQGRDDEIQATAEQFQQLKAETNAKARVLQEKEALLEEERAANELTERKVQAQERSLDVAQQTKNRLTEELQRFESELDSVRNTVHRTVSSEHQRRAEVAKLEETSRDWKRKIGHVGKAIEQKKAEVLEARKLTMSAEEQAAYLDRLMDEEEAAETALHVKLERSQDVHAKASQSLVDLKHKEASMTAEISASRAMILNMKSKLRALEKQELDDQQLLYKQDFEIASLERKLSRMMGQNTDKEDEEEKARIEELKVVLEGHHRAEKLLKTQLQRLDDELRLTRKRVAKATVAHDVLSEKLSELMLEIRRSQDDLKKISGQKEDLMVNENILKLEIRRARKQLNRRADDVFSLEQQELQLKAAMEERMAEIAIHVELLQTQLRAARDARSVVTKELAERVSRIDQLKKRHEIIVFSTAAPSEDGEKKSQAYLLVQAAQEREELQSLGDKLDTKIRKGEKEVRQLENVLYKMNGKNHKYRTSLLKVEGDDQDARQKQKLEMQLRTAMDSFRHKRRERNALQEQVEEVSEMQMRAQDELQHKQHFVGETAASIRNLDEELAEQERKRERAVSFSEQVVKLHRKEAGDPGSETDIELDFQARQARAFNRQIMEAFDGLVQQHPEISTELSMLYDRAGLKRPAPGRRGGSSMSSVSSVSRGGSRAAGRASRKAPSSSTEAAAAAQSKRGSLVTPKTVQLGLGL